MVAFLTLTLQSMCDVTQGIIDLLSCFSWCVRPVPWPSVGMGAGASTLGAQGSEGHTGRQCGDGVHCIHVIPIYEIMSIGYYLYIRDNYSGVHMR